MIEKEQKRFRLQSYEKPKLRTIELAAEEVLGTSCKNEQVSPSPFIDDFCHITQCAAEGS
jgi:hypothetical protein